MPSSKAVKRDNSRIELLAEAIEALAIGISASALAKVDGNKAVPKQVQEFLKAGQASLREALRAFMAPNLNLVETGPRQAYDETVPPEHRVQCAKCGKQEICDNVQCPDWHAAIQVAIADSVGLDEEEDEPDSAA